MPLSEPHGEEPGEAGRLEPKRSVRIALANMSGRPAVAASPFETAAARPPQGEAG